MKSTSEGGQKLDMANLNGDGNGREATKLQAKLSFGKGKVSSGKVERENVNPILAIREVENEPNSHTLRPKQSKWKVQARK